MAFTEHQRSANVTRIWTHRREREIALRVYYDVRDEHGCRIYSLNSFEALE